MCNKHRKAIYVQNYYFSTFALTKCSGCNAANSTGTYYIMAQVLS